MKYLSRYVIPYIAACWHEVGYELLDPEKENEAQLEIIKNETGLSTKEQARKMLTFWLDKNPYASWNDLIRVFRVPHIGLVNLAYNIEGILWHKGKHV